MDDQLAKNIVKEIRKSSELECAVIDRDGEIYYQSENFSQGQNKKIPISPELLGREHGQKEFFVTFNKGSNVTSALTQVIKSIIEVMVDQYHSLRSLAEVEQSTDNFTYEYLTGKTISGPQYWAIAEGATGYRKNMNMVAILIEITDPGYLLLNKKEVKEGERDEIIHRVRRNIENIFHNFYTKHPLSIVLYLGGQNFLVWKNMGPKAENYLSDFKKTLPTLHFNLTQDLRTPISMGVGNPKKATRNIKESYLEAETAIKFGQQNWGPNKIYSYDDFGAIAPMYNGAIENNLEFRDEAIEKISNHEGLLKTLEEFIENELSLTKTAKRLRIHRNTLVYRLDKIFEITGLDPRIFNDAFELQIALIMEKTHAN